MKSLSPYVAGIIIGLIIIFNMVVTDDYYEILKPLSTPSPDGMELIEKCEGGGLKCVRGNYHSKHRYMAYLPLLIGLILGSFIAAIRSKSFKICWYSHVGFKQIFKKPMHVISMFIISFIGGLMLQFGGYYISGSAFGIWNIYEELAQGSLYSLIVVLSIMAGGIIGSKIFKERS